MSRNSFVVGYAKRGRGDYSDLWILDLSGHRRPLVKEEDPKCRFTDYVSPRRLPDGRLGFLKICAEKALGPWRYLLMAFDLRSRTSETLTEAPIHAMTFSWNPSLTRAIAAESSDICSGIAFLSEDRMQTIPTTISGGDKSFRLDGEFRGSKTDCTATGLADWPAWSPDGSDIAFFASAEAKGLGGFARLEVTWDLFFMDADGGDVRSRLSGLVLPNNLEWSPDGDTIAFGATIDGRGTGVWIFRPKSETLVKIADFEVQSIAWSPNGDQLAVLRGVRDSDMARPQYEIWTTNLEDAG